MPIYKEGGNNPNSIFVEGSSIGKVYFEQDLVWQKATEVKYGLLYNWYAATDARNIAPAGWHVPTGLEWCSLFEYSGATIVFTYWIATPNTVGGKFKTIGYTFWGSPNTGASNVYDFNARGAGSRSEGGAYNLFNQGNYFWGLKDASFGMAYYLSYNNSEVSAVSFGGASLKQGFSLRLIKDDSTDPGTMTDNNGNIYPTVKIGNQVWMAANLRTTKYRNGDAIPEVTDNSAWAALTTGALCAYDNDWGNV